jgi:hypothetical protein
MTVPRTTSATNRTSTSGPVRTDALLRTALRVDAAVTGLNGVGYLVAAPLLDDVLGIPAGPLSGIGGFLLAFAVAVWAVGARPTITTGAGVAVVAANLLWVAASIAAAVGGWGTATTLGTAWIVLQAAVVAGFAGAQSLGLRNQARAVRRPSTHR